MLVLTRKVGQSIHIGDEIRLTVLSVQGHSVKVGILAPKDIAVHRNEIFERIIVENRLAVAGASLENAQKLMRFGGLTHERE